jgi:amino acid transporter
MKVQGQNLDDIPFQALLGVWGSYFGLAFAILCVIAQFYIAVFPIGASPNANDFFINMLALPIILVLFIGWKLWKKTEFVRLSEIDLLTGRREIDLAAAKAEERAEKAVWPMWKKYSPGLKSANIKGLLLAVLSMTVDRKGLCDYL